jgi:hypothetical protein
MARTRQRPSVLDESIVRTKLHHPPPRRDELVRSRLVEHLTRGTRGPLTLVAAPADFGKTTLVSTWRAECPAAVAWLALERVEPSVEDVPMGGGGAGRARKRRHRGPRDGGEREGTAGKEDGAR